MFRCKRNRVAVRAALLALALCAVAPAWADSLRCGRSLVSTGDTVAELREACGEPRVTEPGTYQRFGLARGKPVRVQRWRYRRAKGRYEGIVVVYRGEVVAIERGERR
jgi:hypothetical protein